MVYARWSELRNRQPDRDRLPSLVRGLDRGSRGELCDGIREFGDIDRMTYQEALDATDEGRIERIRWLCSDENPDIETREGYRAMIIRRATGEPEPPPPEAPDPETAALQAYLANHPCTPCH